MWPEYIAGPLPALPVSDKVEDLFSTMTSGYCSWEIHQELWTTKRNVFFFIYSNFYFHKTVIFWFNSTLILMCTALLWEKNGLLSNQNSVFPLFNTIFLKEETHITEHTASTIHHFSCLVKISNNNYLRTNTTLTLTSFSFFTE